MPAGKTIPNRGMPESAQEVTSPVKEEAPKIETSTTVPIVASPQPTRGGRVQFGAVDFAKDADEGKREVVLSPTDDFAP